MNGQIEKIKQLNQMLPERFAREYYGRGGIIAGALGVVSETARAVTDTRELLVSHEMEHLIEKGQITMAMIKPRLDLHLDTGKAKVTLTDDAELTDFLVSQISEPLKPILSVSLQMTPAMLEEFYGGEGGPMRKMMRLVGSDMRRSVWDEFNDLMDSGPVTFVLLYSAGGNAVQEWRNQMGPSFDVTKNPPKALRSLAKSNDNNLLHGSDSMESVYNEIQFLARHMK